MKDEIEKPNIKDLEKYINKLIGMPITDIPKTHIVIKKTKFEKNEFLKLFT